MKYSIHLPGFEGQTIELQPAGLITGAKLLVNGEPAPKGPGRGEMLLRRNDGKDVLVRFKNAFIDIPSLMVEDEIIQVVEPLNWYEWVWNGLPLLMVFGGGVIPILIGFFAFEFNLSIFRAKESSLAKYGLTALVSLAALILFLLVAFGFSFLAN